MPFFLYFVSRSTTQRQRERRQGERPGREKGRETIPELLDRGKRERETEVRAEREVNERIGKKRIDYYLQGEGEG